MSTPLPVEVVQASSAPVTFARLSEVRALNELPPFVLPKSSSTKSKAELLEDQVVVCDGLSSVRELSSVTSSTPGFASSSATAAVGTVAATPSMRGSSWRMDPPYDCTRASRSTAAPGWRRMMTLTVPVAPATRDAGEIATANPATSATATATAARRRPHETPRRARSAVPSCIALPSLAPTLFVVVRPRFALCRTGARRRNEQG